MCTVITIRAYKKPASMPLHWYNTSREHGLYAQFIWLTLPWHGLFVLVSSTKLVRIKQTSSAAPKVGKMLV